MFKRKKAITTNLYSLPLGTKFFIVNGAWYGIIVEIGGKKHVECYDNYTMDQSCYVHTSEIFPDDYENIIEVLEDE